MAAVAAVAAVEAVAAVRTAIPAGRVVPGERVAQRSRPDRRALGRLGLSLNPPVRRLSVPTSAAEVAVVRPSATASPELTRGAGSHATKRGRALVSGRALVIGCGALARELLEVAARIPGLEIACLPPDLHNRPEGIPGAVRRRIAAARAEGFERIFIAYADCGTGGLLDPVLAEEGVERLPGAHCYEVFAGSEAFAAMAEAEPATFWLTDFLARNFERLVIRGLGIDRHPELEAMYFGNYRRVVYLSQTDDPELLALARAAAARLGLAFEHRPTGVAHLAVPIAAFAAAAGPYSRGAGVSDEIRAAHGSDAPEPTDHARPVGTPGLFLVDRVADARGTGVPRPPAADTRSPR